MSSIYIYIYIYIYIFGIRWGFQPVVYLFVRFVLVLPYRVVRRGGVGGACSALCAQGVPDGTVVYLGYD